MAIQAADFDTVFEALLDRTAYLKAHTTSVKETVYNVPGDYVHTWTAPTFIVGQARMVEITAIGGGGGGGGGPTAGTAAGAGGGSSGRWQQFWIDPTVMQYVMSYGGTSAVHVGAGGGGGVGPTAGQAGEATTLRLTSSSLIGYQNPFTFPGGLGGGAATAGGPGFGAQATAVSHAAGFAAGAAGLPVGGTAAGAGEIGYNVPPIPGGGLGGQGGIGYGAGGGGGMGSSFTPGGHGGSGVNRHRPIDGVTQGGGTGLSAQGTGGAGAPGLLVIREYFVDFTSTI